MSNKLKLQEIVLPLITVLILFVGVVGSVYGANLSEITEVLEHEDSFERWRAVRQLRELGEEALPYIIEALSDEALNVRQAAASALADFAPEAEEAIAPLAELLFDSSTTVRTAVVNTLGQFGSAAEDVAGDIALLLGDSSFQVRRAVNSSLRALGLNDEIVSLLERKLDAEESFKPVMAVRALIAARLADQFSQERLAAVLLAALSDHSVDVRTEAAELIVELQLEAADIAGGLLSVLADERVGVQLTALSVMEKLGPLGRDVEDALLTDERLLADRQTRMATIDAMIAMDIDPLAPLDRAFKQIGEPKEESELRRIISRAGSMIALYGTGVDVMAERLFVAGYEVVELSTEELISTLRPAQHDVLIIADSPNFPEEAFDQLRGFMTSGGDIVTLGGRAFANSDIEFNYLFEDYEVYQMRQITRIKGNEEQDWFSGAGEIEGDFRGASAVAASFPGDSSFIPVLGAYDQYDRNLGWALGVLVHFSGRFRNSQWALFGIEQESFYKEEFFYQALIEVLDQFHAGDLVMQMSRKQQEAERETVELTAPEPMRVRINQAGTGFEYEDGTPFFMVGVNICGHAGFHHHLNRVWRADVLEQMFKRMHQAGINTLRIRTVITRPLYETVERVNALKQFARKYGVYLLIEIGPRVETANYAEIRQSAIKAAELFADEPMVIGFDLFNEPYPWDIARVVTENGMTLGQRYPHQFGEYNRWVDPGSFSMFENLSGQMPVPPTLGLRRTFENINNVIGAWIAMYTDVFAELAPGIPITVGYNNDYIAYPVNAVLDFVSNHVYPHSVFPDAPVGYEAVKRALTTMDRLHSMWPDKPISIGEFGFTNGLVVDGEFLDIYTSSLAEFVFYLYALANDYSGVMVWQLDDFPLEFILQRWPNITDSVGAGLRQARYGMYFYDGTLAGRAKPIAHATRFFRDFIEHGHQGGNFELTSIEGRDAVGYVYRHANALFIGDIQAEETGITFKAVNDKPTNMMLQWDDNSLRVMSTNDAVVTLTPQMFVDTIDVSKLEHAGNYGWLAIDGININVKLLEGQVLELR